MNENFELENMRQQMNTLKKKVGAAGDSKRSLYPSLDGKDRRQHQPQILLHHGRLPADDPLQLLGIREVERLLHSFLDFHLHHHAG